MNTTDTQKIDMNTTPTTNQRLVTILLVLLIVLMVILVMTVITGFFMVSGGMIGMGTMMNGGMMNDMYDACINMMQKFQIP